MDSEGVKKKLTQTDFENIKKMCIKVGIKTLVEGTKVGHTQAYLACSSVDTIERGLRDIGTHEKNINRMGNIINEKKVRFKEEIKPWEESQDKDVKEIKRLEKNIEEHIEYMKDGRRALEMIIKGEL